MTDICTRLRKWTIATDAVPASDLMDEAADVIQSLQAAFLAAFSDHDAAPTAGASMRECTTPAGIGGTCESLSGSLPADLGDGVSPSENNKNLHHTQARNGTAESGEAVQQPVLWAVVPRVEDEIDCEFVYPCEATAGDVALDAGGVVVPLYRQPQPTLTDAERESLRFCIRGALPETEKLGGVAGELCRMHRDRLRGLLERLGLEHAG